MAATSDAIGIIEIAAAMPFSQFVYGGIDEWRTTEDLAVQKNVVIVGSPAVNVFAYAVDEVAPAGFVMEPNSPLRIRVTDQDGEKLFPEYIEHSEFDKHFGLVLFIRRPLNPKFNILWIAGISGMATQAAARFVRDLVLNPSSTISNSVSNPPSKPTIAVIQPVWQLGWRAEDYQGLWRVVDYKVLWMGSQLQSNL